MLGHILIVDDDKGISSLLEKFLISNGYAISAAKDVPECEALLKEFEFDVIILDVMMPGESGIDFLKRAKGTLKTPVIMLSALGHVDDRVDGLKSGAEDYLPKPFEPMELLLRIQNIMKRSVKHSRLCTFGEYEFNLETLNLSKNKSNIHITTTEKTLLKILCEKAGEMVSREDIQKVMPEISARTIDSQIARLRSKIEADPKSPEFLQTVRGAGYTVLGKSS